MELRVYLLEDNSDCPDWLSDYVSDHWASDIPYAYQTGDEGTIDEWICSHIDQILDHFEEELSERYTKLGMILYG